MLQPAEELPARVVRGQGRDDQPPRRHRQARIQAQRRLGLPQKQRRRFRRPPIEAIVQGQGLLHRVQPSGGDQPGHRRRQEHGHHRPQGVRRPQRVQPVHESGRAPAGRTIRDPRFRRRHQPRPDRLPGREERRREDRGRGRVQEIHRRSRHRRLPGGHDPVHHRLDGGLASPAVQVRPTEHGVQTKNLPPHGTVRHNLHVFLFRQLRGRSVLRTR
mmetsp:Transcript_27465/g.64389  ORF Transcript_27465/g.64389 Transcript_27465/m.64389 type:complete len:216 (+) Transcript_27465:618-1265(+)